MKAHAETKAFRFREMAGDIRIRQARRRVQSLKKMLESAPQEEAVMRMLAQAQDELARLELDEFKLRVEAYPSDLTRKFELGKRFFAVGEYNESITCLQEAQADPKNRVPALLMLGQSFLKIEWIDESIGTFRQALEMREVMPETNLELRYWLMVALQTKGEADRDLDAVVESDKLASSIAVQQITYRDIRQRREAIKKTLGELRGSKGA
jgi:tetratricopeptide (TPR) repeat protein